MRVALAFASGKHDAARIARAFPMSRATAYRYAHMLSEAREGRHDTNTITRSMWIADRLRGRAIDFDTVRELVPAMSRASVYRVLRFLKDARGEP